MIRTLDALPASLRPHVGSRLPALFAHSAGSWLRLDVGADWRPGQVHTVVAKGDPAGQRRMQGFRCVYREVGGLEGTVVLSQERHGPGGENDGDDWMLAAAARTVHTLADQVGRSLPLPSAGSHEDRSQPLVIADRRGAIRRLVSADPQLQVAVLTWGDLVAVVAAHRTPLDDLLPQLSAHATPAVSATGLIIIEPGR